MKSYLSDSEALPLFRANVLGKYDVQYFRCPQTGYIQTETPYWLDEAYASAITTLDIGLVQRNLDLRKRVLPILKQFFDPQATFLDYAGGYGLFVRLMRDAGLNFYRQDPYCQNLLAEHFDEAQLPDNTTIELVTAFEVFEHWVNPIEDLKKVLSYSRNILFSTLLQPEPPPQKPEDWWYFTPEMGQHISLYTRPALQQLAERFGLYFYTDGVGLHLFTEQALPQDPFRWEQKLSFRLLDKLHRLLHRFDSRRQPELPSRLNTDFRQLKKNM